MIRISRFHFLSAAFLLSGCASTYKPINPERFEMQSSAAPGAPVEVAYRHHVLGKSGNFLYDDKARKNQFDLVAIRIKNNTDRPINTKTDLDYNVGGEHVVPLAADKMPIFVRQKTGAYFFYLLLSPIIFYKSEVKCENWDCEEDTSVFPIGLILGLILTGVNAGMSSSANASFEKELAAKDVLGRTLQPGQEITGLLVLRDGSDGPITARLKGDAAPAPAPSPAPSTGPEADPADAGDFR